jgi:hypothetical protein
MRASLSYEKLFVKKRGRENFQTLVDVRACIFDPRKLSISDCITKRADWARQSGRLEPPRDSRFLVLPWQEDRNLNCKPTPGLLSM